MGKRSRSATATRLPVVSADRPSVSSASPHSPPFKKHAAGVGHGVGIDGDKDTSAVPYQACQEVQLSSAIPSVSSSSSPVESLTSSKTAQQGWGGFARAGRKRSRHAHIDLDNSLSDSSDSLRSSTRRRGEGGTLLGGSLFSPSTVKSLAAPVTNRTLVYDTAGALSPRSNDVPGRPTTASSAASSSPPRPPHRNVLLLTSTPAFLRRGEQRDTEGHSEGYSPTAGMASPLRFMRAAQEFLSPVRSTLLRGLSHVRKSVTGSSTAAVRRRPTAPRCRTKASTPSPPSPWGRLSSIKPARDHLPSLSVDPRSESGRRSRGGQRSQPVASMPTLLSLGVSSISGSRRSSVSATDVWGANENALSRAEGRRRPTIQRDSEDALGSSANVRRTSLSSSRLSSPTVRGMEEAANSTTYHRNNRWRQHHYTASEVMDPQTEGTNDVGSMVLTGPYDVRYASVSSLSESLVNVVSSSRSTAQSSLTSADAAAGTGAHQKIALSAAFDTSARATHLRHSGSLEDPNLSSILPDEEERAIRRRMQRHGCGRSQGKPAPAQKGLLPQQAATNVLELPSVGPPAADVTSTDFQARRGKPPRTSANFVSDAGGAQHSSGATSSTNRPRPERPPFQSVTASTPIWHLAGRTARTAFALCAVVAALWCVAATAWPLMALQAPYTGFHGRSFATTTTTSYAHTEAAFLYTYVNPVSDLQALYQIAPASLNAEEVDRLHRRTLSEGVERLERATQHLIPQDNSPPLYRLLYFRSMIHAYVAVQRNSGLYARSRDASHWRRLVSYPLADVLKYGFQRFGSLSRGVSLTRSLARDWLDRILTSVACSAQSEFVSCPSLLYIEEAMARAAAPFVYTDANEFYESSQRRRQLQEWRTRLHRDWGSEVYLETLLSYVRSSVQELARDYNC